MTGVCAFLPSKALSYGLKSPLCVSRDLPSNLRCGACRTASQEPVAGPCEISNLGDKLRLNPMHARENER
jgi:hypothetical protein